MSYKQKTVFAHEQIPKNGHNFRGAQMGYFAGVIHALDFQERKKTGFFEEWADFVSAQVVWCSQI